MNNITNLVMNSVADHIREIGSSLGMTYHTSIYNGTRCYIPLHTTNGTISFSCNDCHCYVRNEYKFCSCLDYTDPAFTNTIEELLRYFIYVMNIAPQSLAGAVSNYDEECWGRDYRGKYIPITNREIEEASRPPDYCPDLAFFKQYSSRQQQAGKIPSEWHAYHIRRLAQDMCQTGHWIGTSLYYRSYASNQDGNHRLRAFKYLMGYYPMAREWYDERI